MKTNRRLKIALIILLIILISIVSFVGIFVQNKNAMENILADYQLGRDLKGSRVVTLSVDESTETIYYDKDGKVVETKAKDGKEEEKPVNNPDVLNKENYLKTKEIIKKRLEDLRISDYIIRQNEKNGAIIVQMPEEDTTDTTVQFLNTVGKFSIQDSESKDVLLDNSNIDKVTVTYGSSTTGTAIYLNIKVTDDSIEKLKEISNTYKASTDEKGNDTGKKVTFMLDNSELISTSFGSEITSGVIQLSIGSESTDQSELNSYVEEASNLAILINNGTLPISYIMEQNRYIGSDISSKDIVTVGIVLGAIILLFIVGLIIKYKKNGLLAGIAHIGYIAILLLILRYTNVVITLNGVAGIIASIALNYIVSVSLLKAVNKDEDTNKMYNKAMINMIFVLIPTLIVGITFCFANWMSVFSLGAIIFWGILLLLIYNAVVTKSLLCSAKNQ